MRGCGRIYNGGGRNHAVRLTTGLITVSPLSPRTQAEQEPEALPGPALPEGLPGPRAAADHPGQPVPPRRAL